MKGGGKTTSGVLPPVWGMGMTLSGFIIGGKGIEGGKTGSGLLAPGGLGPQMNSTQGSLKIPLTNP